MYSLNENFLSGLAVLSPNYRPSNKNPNKRYKKLKSPLQIKARDSQNIVCYFYCSWLLSIPSEVKDNSLLLKIPCTSDTRPEYLS